MKNKRDWNHIYANNAPKLIGTVRRYVRNTTIAEDIVHDAFITAIDKEHTFSENGSFDGWLYRIVINTALQYLRKNKNEVVSEEQTMEVLGQNEDKEPENLSLKAQITAFGFTQSDLLLAIDALPQHHKSVFNLYVLENFKHSEIGKMLGISAGTSKSHLARGRKKIQAILTAKVQSKNNEEEDPRFALLLIIPSWGGELTNLYQNSFSNFHLPITKKPQLTAAEKSILGKTGVKTFLTLSKVTSGILVLGIGAMIVYSNLTKKAPIISAKEEVIKDTGLSNKVEFKDSIIGDVAVADTIKQTIKKKIIIVKKTVIVRDTIYATH